MPGKPPYFSFYPKDFAADDKVEMMCTTAVGAYTLLMCKAWHQEPAASLPDDDELLARWARVTPNVWKKIKTRVLDAFYVGDDGRLYQKRLKHEYERFVAKSQKAKESADKRWKKKEETEAKTNANAMPSHSERNALAMQRAYGSGSDSDSPSDGGSAEGGGFDDFWAIVPHKIGKGAARKAYAAARKIASHDEIAGGVAGYAAYEKKRREQCGTDFRPLHPATWLNGERWTDEHGTKKTDARQDAQKYAEDAARRRAEEKEGVATPEERAAFLRELRAKIGRVKNEPGDAGEAGESDVSVVAEQVGANDDAAGDAA